LTDSSHTRRANTDSESSSVGGAVPTSPPAPERLRNGAGVCPHCRRWLQLVKDEGYKLLPVLVFPEGAAPTSTPLDALIAKWRAKAVEHGKHNDAYQTAQGWARKDCADELEKLLAASPASALVTGEASGMGNARHTHRQRVDGRGGVCAGGSPKRQKCLRFATVIQAQSHP
jgi:hypothetical protein